MPRRCSATNAQHIAAHYPMARARNHADADADAAKPIHPSPLVQARHHHPSLTGHMHSFQQPGSSRWEAHSRMRRSCECFALPCAVAGSRAVLQPAVLGCNTSALCCNVLRWLYLMFGPRLGPIVEPREELMPQHRLRVSCRLLQPARRGVARRMRRGAMAARRGIAT